jgi:hypothetical protein
MKSTNHFDLDVELDAQPGLIGCADWDAAGHAQGQARSIAQ